MHNSVMQPNTTHSLKHASCASKDPAWISHLPSQEREPLLMPTARVTRGAFSLAVEVGII